MSIFAQIEILDLCIDISLLIICQYFVFDKSSFNKRNLIFCRKCLSPPPPPVVHRLEDRSDSADEDEDESSSSSGSSGTSSDSEDEQDIRVVQDEDQEDELDAESQVCLIFINSVLVSAWELHSRFSPILTFHTDQHEGQLTLHKP